MNVCRDRHTSCASQSLVRTQGLHVIVACHYHLLCSTDASLLPYFLALSSLHLSKYFTKEFGHWANPYFAHARAPPPSTPVHLSPNACAVRVRIYTQRYKVLLVKDHARPLHVKMEVNSYSYNHAYSLFSTSVGLELRALCIIAVSHHLLALPT